MVTRKGYFKYWNLHQFWSNRSKIVFLHVYLMYLKFGFKSDNGRWYRCEKRAMSRSQAVKLVQMYDDVYPEEFFEEYCEYYKMSMEDFKEYR